MTAHVLWQDRPNHAPRPRAAYWVLADRCLSLGVPPGKPVISTLPRLSPGAIGVYLPAQS